jgi:hypothetical protein
VTRWGTPIDEYPLRGAVATGIEVSASTAIYDALVEAGLDLWKWENEEYPSWFLAQVMEWAKNRALRRDHVEDAKDAAIRRRSKKKGK